MAKSNLNLFTTVENLPNLEDNINKSLIIYNANSNHKEELSLKKGKNLILDNLISLKLLLLDKLNIFWIMILYLLRNRIMAELLNMILKGKLWQYINRNDEKDIYFMKFWSRRFKELPFNAKIRNN